MKKTITLLILSAIIIGGSLYFGLKELKQNEKESIKIEKEVSADTKEIIKIKEKNQEPIEKEIPMNVPDSIVMNYIHAMSHQKVKASEKWGFTPMTTERIKRLKYVVENGNYEDKETYLEILNRWEKGDFSQVDKEHNIIWKMQNGTVGKAKGILSPQEEQIYIKEYYIVEK